MDIDFSLLELYSESDLKDQISKNIKMVKFLSQQNKKLAETLKYLQDNDKELAKFHRVTKKKQKLEYCTNRAEIIELIVSEYMNKYWFNLSYVFDNVCREYNSKLIHSDCRAYHCSIPRMIMIYFIAQKSGLNKSQIAKYFEMESHASIINAVNTVEKLYNKPLFAYHLDKLIDKVKQNKGLQ